MRNGLLAATMLLGGCVVPDLEPAKPIPLRNPTALVASQSDVTLDRLVGDWVVVSGAGIAAGTSVNVSQGAVRIGGLDAEQVSTVQAGRYRFGGRDVWVHWLDVSNRTAALGDPNGSRVWIMDRSPKSSPDRQRAAREILEWYGYDVKRMESL